MIRKYLRYRKLIPLPEKKAPSAPQAPSRGRRVEVVPGVYRDFNYSGLTVNWMEGDALPMDLEDHLGKLQKKIVTLKNELDTLARQLNVIRDAFGF